MADLVDVLERSRALGFLGPMPVADQLDHASGFGEVVEARLGRQPRSVIDLGSGGGVPGLVLADRWPRTALTLLDSSVRRAEFLREAVETLKFGERVAVVELRAEEFGRQEERRQSFEVVTARSFAPPGPTAECAAPLLEVGGILVVSEPPIPDETRRWPKAGVDQLGLVAHGASRPDDSYAYQCLSKVNATPEGYPRRVGIPSKRPLF